MYYYNFYKNKDQEKNSGSQKKKNKEEEMLNPFHKQTTKTYAVILRPFFSTSHTIEVRFWGQKCIKVIRKVFHEEVSLEQED